MGVRGLTTYINHNQDSFLEQFFLHDCNLVVDGHSLCAQLYRKLNCFSAFGGDYDKFASYTRNFFKSVRKCKIIPYLIFDGSYETRKLRTAYSRLRSKIHGASRLDPVTQSSLQIFPLLLRDVFKEVLLELEVAYTICEFEADDEIAALARHLNCPVLSYDSDFFIYNVLYIPFNTLELKPKPVDVDGSKCFALECNIYKVENLTEKFGGLKEEMLPLLATLLGNDYVEKRVFNKFFSQLKMPKSKRKVNEQQRCIHGLFKWLQNETFDSAVVKILGRLKKTQKEKVFGIIKKSVAVYSKRHCNSLKYFHLSDVPETNMEVLKMPEDTAVLEEEINDESSNNSDTDSDDSETEGSVSECSLNNATNEAEKEESGLPEWFEKGIRNKTIPHSYINLYTHHLHFCSPQAEDYTEDDSFLCTLPILRYAFDLLTDFNDDSCTYVTREKNNNSSYKRLLVGTELATPRFFEKPFSDLTNDQLKACFYHFLTEKFLTLDFDTVELLPSNCRLYMISLLWWVSHCKVPLNLVHSLLLCYTMLEAIDEKIGTIRGSNHFKNKYSTKVEEARQKTSVSVSVNDQDLFLNKNKIQYEDCLIAASVLLKHFEIDDSILKRPKSYDVKRMHSIAQFQCCLQQFNSLNTLCGKPFETIKYSKCFSGTFVYNIALKLENLSDPKHFLEGYLKGAHTVLQFYKSLCTVYERCATKMNLSTLVGNSKKSRRRNKKTKNNEEVDLIVKEFEFEVVI